MLINETVKRQRNPHSGQQHVKHSLQTVEKKFVSVLADNVNLWSVLSVQVLNPVLQP